MKRTALLSFMCIVCYGAWAETWSLADCIGYAMEHNIGIKKDRILEEQDESTLKMHQSALWPSLSFNTQHGVVYRPLQADVAARTVDGEVIMSSNKFTENSNYGINMNWTLWNGGVNQRNIKRQEVQGKIDAEKTRIDEMSIQERIVTLYTQILFSKEALNVNRELAETAKKQWQRGEEMLKEGQMSRADVVRLEAQAATANYNMVSSRTTIDNFKRQLKALLELRLDEEFEIEDEVPADSKALEMIPSAQEVLAEAIRTRPEMRSAQLNIEKAEIAYDIAKRGQYPTISLSAGIADSHNTQSSQGVGYQMKQNLYGSAGVNISVPLWDQRKTRSAKEQAKLGITASRLDLEEQKVNLSSSIEQYWLQANSGQQKFIASEVKVKSQRESYELVNEQFANGLKSVIDVIESRDYLLQAEQDKLESKYNTLLNRALLKFYKGENIEL